MRYPVNYISISNGFHTGKSLDFGWWKDEYKYQNVYACEAGTVINTTVQQKGGKVIYIEHADKKVSCYAHLDQVLVNNGQVVSLGEKIGVMGETGVVTGQHLHFGLYSSKSIMFQNADLDPFEYLELYSDQIVRDKTMQEYGSKIKQHGSGKIKYIYNVDDEGLNVRTSPNGSITGSPLTVATQVTVYEESGSWSRIGDNRWVSSKYLADTCPKYYVVSSRASDGLNLRNKPNTRGTLLRVLYPGNRVCIYSTSGTWAKVSPTEERWCSKNYLDSAN